FIPSAVRSFVCNSFFFSSRRGNTRFSRDWSSDVCSSDLGMGSAGLARRHRGALDAAAGPPRSGTALVLFTGYLLLILSGALWLSGGLVLVQFWGRDPLLKALIVCNTAILLLRLIVHIVFIL